MKVKVKLFAVHRQLLGRRELEMDVPSHATVMETWQQLKRQYPEMEHLSNNLLAAVNQDYASFDTHLNEGDEVAFIPPVSGGEHV